MQRQRTRQDGGARVPATAPGAAPDVEGRVRIVAGADVEDMAVAGRTVGEARVLAQAILGIDPLAVAMLDGERVGDDRVLGQHQELEFVKHAGAKGAEAPGPVVEVSDDQAVWRRNGYVSGALPLRDLVARVVAASSERQTWRVLPRFTRLMVTRAAGEVTGVVIEMPPGPRLVRWADVPPELPLHERYVDRRLSFPWVVLLVVFRNGEVTGTQQAYYRRSPITRLEDPLCFTNLLNVGRGSEQASWICFQNMSRRLRSRTWDERIQAVIDHFWQAAFNWAVDRDPRSGYFASGGGID